MFNLTKYFSWLPSFKAHRRNQIILIVAVILVIVVIIGTIYYFYFYPYRDSLLAKAPADSAAYVHFNLPQGMADYQRLNLEPLYGALDEWFGWRAGQFEKDILPLAGKEMALVVVPYQESKDNSKEELKLGKALLINLNRQTEIFPTQLEVLGLFYAFLNRRQLLIADSTTTLEKITKVTKETNLKNQTVIKRELARFSNQSLVKGYLAIEILDKYYQQTQTPQNLSDFNSLLIRLSANFLLQQNEEQIYFSAKKTSDGFGFKVMGLADNLAFKPAGGRGKLIKFIPPNTLIALSGFNWQGLLVALEKSFQATGSGLESFKSNYEKLYRFNWRSDLAPLLSGPGDLVVLKDEQKNKFIFTVKLSEVQEEKPGKLEEIVKEYLAYHLPVEKTRVLPDQSRVAELIADPARFNWQEAELDGLKINFIKEPALAFEFLYIFLDDRLIFSNSLEQFKIFLRNQKEPGPDWLNFNQITRTPFLIRSNEVVLFNLRALKSASFIQEWLANFNYLAVVNTRSGIQGNIF